MGSLLRYCRVLSLRVLLVSSLLALAWLAWGAGSAHASTDPSDAAVPETALDLGPSDAPSLEAAQVLPAGQDPAGSAEPAVFSVSKTAAPVVSTVTKTGAPVASNVTKTAAPVVSTASRATAPVTSTVTKTAAPAVSTVDHAVAAVEDAVASVAKPLPVPAVKLPQLRNLGVPVTTVRRTLPAMEFPARASSVPGTVRPLAKHPAVVVPPSRAAAVPPPAETFAPASALSGTASPAPGASNLAAPQIIDTPFKTLAQLRMTASPRPVVSAIQAPAQGFWIDHLATERLNIAATHGESGSSGSDSSGSHTGADIAGSWSGLSPAAGILAAGASVAPPSGPAADPGSSPD